VFDGPKTIPTVAASTMFGIGAALKAQRSQWLHKLGCAWIFWVPPLWYFLLFSLALVNIYRMFEGGATSLRIFLVFAGLSAFIADQVLFRYKLVCPICGFNYGRQPGMGWRSLNSISDELAGLSSCPACGKS
jgi:hypothetical protein